ncbi:hypothetical protein ACFV2N_01080 [Streptomyces sp. NPDC059680]|uniref:hypothetical protein n=1 Tax=Streptomyces sp. NPDC059680 TaxID=3346904 RepID=UPI00368AB39B
MISAHGQGHRENEPGYRPEDSAADGAPRDVCTEHATIPALLRRQPPARGLTQRVLGKLLTVDIPGANELRAQVAEARVTGRWGEGSPSVDLVVPEWLPAAPVADGLLPVVGRVRNGSGEFIGELLVWVSGGRLSALEFAWYGDDAPTELPEPGLVTVTVE